MFSIGIERKHIKNNEALVLDKSNLILIEQRVELY